MSVIRQLSIFGVETIAPEPNDLAGLLVAGGRVDRLGGTARVSVVVSDPWRAAALVDECARRGLAATSVATVDETVGVRTAYSVLLAPLAEAWLTGDPPRPPRGLRFNGWTLRLWSIVGGRREGTSAYLLPLGPGTEPAWGIIGAALAGVGLPAQLVGPRGGSGPGCRLVGRRRLSRLVELVGDPPKQARAGDWPS